MLIFCDYEGNHGSGITLMMCYRCQYFIHLWD